MENRSWGEYVLENVRKSGRRTRINNVYTLYGDCILIVSYRYKLKDAIKIQEDLLKEDKEIQNIISTIKFP